MAHGGGVVIIVAKYYKSRDLSISEPGVQHYKLYHFRPKKIGTTLKIFVIKGCLCPTRLSECLGGVFPEQLFN